MSEHQALFRLLGLAQRARKIVSGEEFVIAEIKKKSVQLVLLSADAGEQTKKKVLDKCNYYQIPINVIADRKTLGHAIGKVERVVIGIMDKGFAEKMTELLDQ